MPARSQSQRCPFVRYFIFLFALLFSGRARSALIADPANQKIPLRAAISQACNGGECLYYLGVGSNLLKSKLMNRGLNGTKIDFQSFEPAYVRDYRLAFNLMGFPPIEPAMAGIEPCEGSECHGSLARVTIDAYEKIWRSEGGGRPNPSYEEVVVDAIPYGSGVPVKAIVLRAAPHARLKKDGAPSERYMKIILEGARELGLRADYLARLEGIATAKVSRLLRFLCQFEVAFVSLMFRLNFPSYFRYKARLLFAVWAPPTAGPLQRFLSEVAMATVLVPGAALGALVKLSYAIRGKPMPGMFGQPSPPKPPVGK
jgi:hypothetical protein